MTSLSMSQIDLPRSSFTNSSNVVARKERLRMRQSNHSINQTRISNNSINPNIYHKSVQNRDSQSIKSNQKEGDIGVRKSLSFNE